MMRALKQSFINDKRRKKLLILQSNMRWRRNKVNYKLKFHTDNFSSRNEWEWEHTKKKLLLSENNFCRWENHRKGHTRGRRSFVVSFKLTEICIKILITSFFFNERFNSYYYWAWKNHSNESNVKTNRTTSNMFVCRPWTSHEFNNNLTSVI